LPACVYSPSITGFHFILDQIPPPVRYPGKSQSNRNNCR
jgi:hypothetical protein